MVEPSRCPRIPLALCRSSIPRWVSSCAGCALSIPVSMPLVFWKRLKIPSGPSSRLSPPGSGANRPGTESGRPAAVEKKVPPEPAPVIPETGVIKAGDDPVAVLKAHVAAVGGADRLAKAVCTTAKYANRSYDITVHLDDPARSALPSQPDGLHRRDVYKVSMILIRHGQSEFNVRFSATGIDPGIKDAPLTVLGQLQAREAAETLGKARITRIVASPYTRALQTAAPFARRFGLPVEISPLVRERYAYSCDIGHPVSHLATAWPNHDFNHVPDVWWPAETESEQATLARAGQFHVEMAARPDQEETLVISHWGFILAMTGRSVTNCEWVVIEPDADFIARG